MELKVLEVLIKVNELREESKTLNHFLDLELNRVNNKYFSFIKLRRIYLYAN